MSSSWFSKKSQQQFLTRCEPIKGQVRDITSKSIPSNAHDVVEGNTHGRSVQQEMLGAIAANAKDTSWVSVVQRM